MEQDIKKILEYSVYAPSGDNSQPWEFKLSGNKLEVYSQPTIDNPYLNYKNSATLIAHGALLENIIISSKHFGYEIKIVYTNNQNNLVFEIYFTKNDSVVPDSLFEFIKQRHTNRFFYKQVDLPEDVKVLILETTKELGFGNVKIEEREENKKKLGKIVANAEIVILENKLLHSYLFEKIVWSKKQEETKRTGLYVNAMGFNPVQKIMFTLASYWTFMKVAIKIGIPKFIAKEDSLLYASGSAICLLSMDGDGFMDFINTGRLFQRIWLKVISKGLDLQPLSATLFIGKRLTEESENKILSEEHQILMKNSYSELRTVFSVASENPLMMCRIGYAKSKAVSTSRMDIDVKFAKLSK